MALELSEVKGRQLEWTLHEFERRCRIRISQEKDSFKPDQDLIAILSNAVRLKREFMDDMFKFTHETSKVSNARF